MQGELTGPDPFDRPADRDAPLVAVVVYEYRLSRYLVVHRRWCPCERETPYRPRHRSVSARDLRHLLEQVWPHDTPPGFATRDLARRCGIAACAPPLPIHPWHRTLMKEHNTMEKVLVLVCPDATGKFIVHSTTCGHAARLRAAKNGTGITAHVASLPELVVAVCPPEKLAGEGRIEETMEQDFEVRDCTPLPVEEVHDEDPPEVRAQRAVLRAYSALVALATTAATVDNERARDASKRLEQRHATTSVARRASANLSTGDVREHLIASSECAAWVSVRAAAEDELPADASDLDKAKRWVATARAMVHRFEKQWKCGRDEGGTAMGRAFLEAEEEGRLRFIRHAEDALHEVTELMEQRGLA